MRRFALPLAAFVAFGVTGCQYGSRHHQVAAPTAPSYTPRLVQRVFARAGVPLARDHEADTFARTSGNTSFAAFLTDATGDVQVNVSRAVETGGYIVVNVSNGAERRVNKTVGNVSVSYVKRGPQGPRVLRALALLREARPHD